MKSYLTLAKSGDKYSQYRLSEMYLKGLGTQKNPIKAYSWIYVAAEDGHQGISDYRDAIYLNLAEKDISQSEQLAIENLKKYGNMAQIKAAKKSLTKKLSNCTGTRISSNNTCERVIETNAVNRFYYKDIKTLIDKYDKYIKEHTNKPFPEFYSRK